MGAEPAGDRGRTVRRLLLPAGVGLLVFLAYVPGSGRSLDFDSSQTVGSYVRTSSILDAVRSQRLFNNHPAFSLIEHVIYTVTGSAEEWVLRMAPITFAACAAAALVAVLRRHLGTVPAVCAGLFFATNPTVIALSRAVRGYSLLLLCGVVSSVALSEVLGSERGSQRQRSWSITYVGAVALGMATHLYMAPIVLGHFVVVAARRALDSDWWLRWLGGVGLGATIYAAMIPDMVDAMTVGERTFKPEFPRQLGEVMVGSEVAAVLLTVVVAVGAVILVRTRRDLLAAAAAVLAAVAVTWLGTASVHLEARFHVWLVPAAAALVAVAVRRVPLLAVLVVAGGLVNAWSAVDGYVEDPNAEPELGALLDYAAAHGDRGCVTNYSVLPMLGYSSHFEIVLEPADLARCDVVAVPFSNLDGDLAVAARAQMAVGVTYDADYEDGLAFARDPAYFDRLCEDGPADLCPP
jgi:hypothetical protein